MDHPVFQDALPLIFDTRHLQRSECPSTCTTRGARTYLVICTKHDIGLPSRPFLRIFLPFRVRIVQITVDRFGIVGLGRG